MPMRNAEANAARFWAQVEKGDDCWLWQGKKDRKGYGLYFRDGHTRAHRWAYEHTYGAIAPGHFVCHRCDVPSCVRPDHLFAGTPADNSLDSVKKGRHGRAKLTADLVISMRSLAASGVPLKEVARRYGVKTGSIHGIISGHRWRHIADAYKRPPITHCLRGHAFSPENTRVYAGRRHCAECQRLRQRKGDARHAA